jgi:hypothetical protein
MGHSLDPLLDQVMSKYSHDVQEAYESGLREGIDEAIFLTRRFRDLESTGPAGSAWMNALIGYLEVER